MCYVYKTFCQESKRPKNCKTICRWKGLKVRCSTSVCLNIGVNFYILLYYLNRAAVNFKQVYFKTRSINVKIQDYFLFVQLPSNDLQLYLHKQFFQNVLLHECIQGTIYNLYCEFEFESHWKQFIYISLQLLLGINGWDKTPKIATLMQELNIVNWKGPIPCLIPCARNGF